MELLHFIIVLASVSFSFWPSLGHAFTFGMDVHIFITDRLLYISSNPGFVDCRWCAPSTCRSVVESSSMACQCDSHSAIQPLDFLLRGVTQALAAPEARGAPNPPGPAKPFRGPYSAQGQWISVRYGILRGPRFILQGARIILSFATVPSNMKSRGPNKSSQRLR